jgi:hypothetical protein
MLNFGRETPKDHSGDVHVDGRMNLKCSCLKVLWCENVNCTECDLVRGEVLETARLIIAKDFKKGKVRGWGLYSTTAYGLLYS